MLGIFLLAYFSMVDMIYPTPEYLFPIIKEKARKYELDPMLVLAVIETESKGHVWASRYEPGFFRKYIEGKTLEVLPGKFPSPKTPLEKKLEYSSRSTSFGLMQLMLQTAREIGFTGYPTELFNPEINIELGCKYLRKRINRANGSISKGLLGFNGGGDPYYDDKVLDNLEALNYMSSRLNS